MYIKICTVGSWKDDLSTRGSLPLRSMSTTHAPSRRPKLHASRRRPPDTGGGWAILLFLYAQVFSNETKKVGPSSKKCWSRR